MRVIEVDIDVECQSLGSCTVLQRLGLFMLYFRMAVQGLCGQISRIKISPVYGGESDSSCDMPDYDND